MGLDIDLDALAFNGFSFAAGLLLLQYGCDIFVDNFSILLRRLGFCETMIALVSTGAEWEELAVVIAAIIQKRPSLGLGNVIGSSIANILGAFGLGLLFHAEPMPFDLSAKIYAFLLVIMTSSFTIVGLRDHLDITGGIFFMVAFGVYCFAIGSAVYEGFLSAPDEVEYCFITDEERTAIAAAQENTPRPAPPTILVSDSDALPARDLTPPLSISIFSSTVQVDSTRSPSSEETPLIGLKRRRTSSLADFIKVSGRRSFAFENTPIFRTSTTRTVTIPPRDKGNHKFSYYITKALIGILLLAFSGYVLSHSAATLASMFHISDTIMGLTILSIGTTLPEKLMSIVSIQQEHGNIMVATTSGANIFLLSLCLGVVYMATDDGGQAVVGMTLLPFEIWTAFGCSIIMWVIVWTGGYKFMGGLMFGLYAGFIGAELSLFRR